MKLKLLVLIALAGLIAVWYFSKPKPATAPQVSPAAPTTSSTTTNTQVNTIAYTDTGFSPKTITVKPGTTVTFVNQSSTNMWVASAVHPTHLELPGFDQLEGAGNGSTYSYTFNEVGTWKFHDHLNPKTFGSVIVEE